MKALLASALLASLATSFAESEKVPDFVKVGGTYDMGVVGQPVFTAKILADRGNGWYFVESQVDAKLRFWLNLDRVDIIWPEGVTAGAR